MFFSFFSEDEEKVIVQNLQLCAEWGYPLTPFEPCLIIKRYLVTRKRTVRQFKSGVYPGRDFANSFLKRHKDALVTRLCQIHKAKSCSSFQKNLPLLLYEPRSATRSAAL